ncbi:MAG: Fe-S cluster assembly protein SufB [Candidatus Gracilibacteria bacterium]|nr:Fe-S cluster assembly protein SufB [Candidatus Gracilibacteria bacterium]
MTTIKQSHSCTDQTCPKHTAEYIEIFETGISEDVVRKISAIGSEPDWMLEHRLKALKVFFEKPLPTWGPSLDKLDLDQICYFAKVEGSSATSNWEKVPENVRQTFEEYGLAKAERENAISGLGAQYDSEVVYHSLKKELEEKGVIFEDMGIALRKYEDLVKKYFMKNITIYDHKFSALHGAVWSGGTFLYVPKGVIIDEPLQAYFRMNMKAGGQFEHTLIVVEEDAQAHYIEGCSAPRYETNSLHAGCVEIWVGERSKFRYSSVENWSTDTYNLNTKRAIVEKDGFMEWVSGNFGSGVTMLYPCSVLKGDNSSSEHLGVVFANKNQNSDVGSKVIHIGQNTSSKIVSKSLSKNGGISTYRGLVDIKESAIGSVSKVQCDALILDSDSRSDTLPDFRIMTSSSIVAHEASAGKINENDLFYLQSRGISEEEAKSMIVNGFVSPVLKELPFEYAAELNVLISMEMENSGKVESRKM